MAHRDGHLLRVRRIAIVFDCLVPVDLADDVVAYRLVEVAGAIADVAGVEILPRGEHELGAELPAGRRRFWPASVARRARHALPPGAP